MLKLATVFSGIGAIEHALDRMHVDHEIVFACDNGDVELEMPKVKVDIDAIETELKVLKKKVKAFNLDFADEESVDYAAQLDVMLVGVEGELKKLLERLEVSDDELKVINEALGDVDRILKSSMDATTASKKKKYKELLEIRNDSASDKAKLFFLLRVTLTLINDEIEYDSEPLKIIAKRYEQSIKKIIKSGKDLSERLDMIYDKLFYLDANIELKQLDSYEARKKYVDSLYAGKESQNKVKKSYMANYKISEKDFHWNVAFLDGKQYEGQVDLFVGGSPCQSFSLVGKQRGLEDTRGTLFYEYARLIKEIKPKVFIYENVKAILSNDGGRTWEKMKEVFADLGYNVYYTYNGKPSVLNARDYGIPQNRERMFVVGFRQDINMIKEFEFPTPIPLEKRMQDFLSEKVEKYVMATGTKNFYSRPKTDLEVARPLLTTMHKMHRAGVDNYVHTNGRLRKLTPRECLRLMGFCDSFKIVVSDTSMYQQAGNSIVVDVLIAIMRQIFNSVAEDELV